MARAYTITLSAAFTGARHPRRMLAQLRVTRSRCALAAAAAVAVLLAMLMLAAPPLA